MSKLSKGFAYIGLAIAGLIVGSVVAVQAWSAGDEVFERHVVPQPYPGLEQLVETSDVVITARYVGFSEDTFALQFGPEDEGYIEGEPSDVFSALNFEIEQVIKGGLVPGDTAQVQVMSALQGDGEKIRVTDKRLLDFQHPNGTLRDAKNDNNIYVLFLLDNELSVEIEGDYRSRGWGIGRVLPNGKVVLPALGEGSAHRFSLDDLMQLSSS